MSLQGKLQKTSLPKNSLIFLAAYGLFILSMTIEFTSLRYSFDKGLQLMRYAAYALFLFKIALEAVYRKKDTFIFVLLLLLSILQSRVTGMREICFLLLMLFACYRVEIKAAFKVQIAVQMVCLLGVFALCALGILENLEYFDHGRIRYTMGFVYINGAGSVFFSSELAWLFLRNRQISIKEVLLILCGWGVIFYYTDLRTMTLLGCAAVLAVYVTRRWRWSVDRGMFKALFLAVPAGLFLFSWVLQWCYNLNSGHALMQSLNAKLNGRLNLAKKALELYDINLWGNRIAWIGNADNLNRNKYNFVDCSYIRIPLDYGLIIGVFFLAAFCFIMYRLVKQNNQTGCILFCIILLCGFMMNVLTGVSYNPFLLLAGGIFHGKAEVHRT